MIILNRNDLISNVMGIDYYEIDKLIKVDGAGDWLSEVILTNIRFHSIIDDIKRR